MPEPGVRFVPAGWLVAAVGVSRVLLRGGKLGKLGIAGLRMGGPAPEAEARRVGPRPRRGDRAPGLAGGAGAPGDAAELEPSNDQQGEIGDERRHDRCPQPRGRVAEQTRARFRNDGLRPAQIAVWPALKCESTSSGTTVQSPARQRSRSSSDNAEWWGCPFSYSLRRRVATRSLADSWRLTASSACQATVQRPGQSASSSVRTSLAEDGRAHATAERTEGTARRRPDERRRRRGFRFRLGFLCLLRFCHHIVPLPATAG